MLANEHEREVRPGETVTLTIRLSEFIDIDFADMELCYWPAQPRIYLRVVTPSIPPDDPYVTLSGAVPSSASSGRYSSEELTIVERSGVRRTITIPNRAVLVVRGAEGCVIEQPMAVPSFTREDVIATMLKSEPPMVDVSEVCTSVNDDLAHRSSAARASFPTWFRIFIAGATLAGCAATVVLAGTIGWALGAYDGQIWERGVALLLLCGAVFGAVVFATDFVNITVKDDLKPLWAMLAQVVAVLAALVVASMKYSTAPMYTAPRPHEIANTQLGSPSLPPVTANGPLHVAADDIVLGSRTYHVLTVCDRPDLDGKVPFVGRALLHATDMASDTALFIPLNDPIDDHIRLNMADENANLDVVFVGATGRVGSVVAYRANVDDGSVIGYGRYIVVLAGGEAQRAHIAAGSRLQFTGTCTITPDADS